MAELSLLKKIANIVVPSVQDGSESIRNAIGIGDRALGEIAVEIEALEKRRAALLLDGNDSALDKIEGDLAAAGRSKDRTHARLGELRERLKEAEAREQVALMEATHRRALHHQSAEERLAREYRDIALKLRDLLIELQAHVEERKAAIKTLREGGDMRKVMSGALALNRRTFAMWGDNMLSVVALPDPMDSNRPLLPLNGPLYQDYEKRLAEARARVRATAST